VDPVPDPLLLRKSGSAGDRTRDLCICSQKLWPLDHRGGLCWTPTRTKFQGTPLSVTVSFLYCTGRYKCSLGKTERFFELWDGWCSVPCFILLLQMAWRYCLLSLLCMEHGAVIAGKGNPRCPTRNLPQSCSARHKSHIDWSGTKLRPRQ